MCDERDRERKGGEKEKEKEIERKRGQGNTRVSMSVHLCKVFLFDFFFKQQQQLEQYFHKDPMLYSLWWSYRLSGSPELASFHVFYIEVSGSSQVQQS